MNSFSFNKRAFIGILIVLMGVAFLLDALNVLDTDNIFSTYWPVLLILFGLMNLLDRSSSNLLGGILVLVGVFFQLQTLGFAFEEISLWNLFWPIIIIMVGLWFVFPKKKLTYSTDTLNSTVLFSGANISNISQTFKGGDVTAIFGGLDVDLRGCDFEATENVVIDAFTAFGGIEIKVPEGWYVEMKGLPLLGGWDNKKRFDKSNSQPTKVITVKCFIICGGIDIK